MSLEGNSPLATSHSPLFLLQICTFVFNNFQDAHPTTLFFSYFCIVAGGGYTPTRRELEYYLNCLHDLSCSFLTSLHIYFTTSISNVMWSPC